MPKGRDGPETRLCEVCAFRSFFAFSKGPQYSAPLLAFLRVLFERPPR